MHMASNLFIKLFLINRDISAHYFKNYAIMKEWMER